MKAARMFAVRDVRVVESPTPEPAPTEVLLRVRACAICASDLHMYEEGHSSGVYPSGPIILGHEFSGEVAACGADMTDWQIGERVACEPSWHCSHCDMCERGLTNLCRHIIFPSYPDRDGAMAEYIAVPGFSLAKLPGNVDFIGGALAEPLGVALHAVRLSGLQPGMKIAILGAGAIGLSILQTCQAFGAGEIFVAEPREGRRAAPARLGARVAASAEELKPFWEGSPEPDVVFEAAGGDHSFAEALDLARPEGKVMVLGIPSLDLQQYSAKIPRRKEVTVVFCRRSRNTLHECLAMLSDGRLKSEAFPTRNYTLDQSSEALEDSIRREGAVVRAIVCP
ncbi:alcohol dehydrogenase catalytic domain-containing protein [bacterium]|nr:alcohol dehydrogenase catalytic domain-containing protein [bacterium]